jgi:hypothetical protein
MLPSWLLMPYKKEDLKNEAKRDFLLDNGVVIGGWWM